MTVGLELFNSRLGVNPVALKVLRHMRDMHAFRLFYAAIARATKRGAVADIKAAAWYNGRERGIVVYVDAYGFGPRTCVAFGEHRSWDHRSWDHVFVDRWSDPVGGMMNPPVYTDKAYEAGYNGRRCFAPNEVGIERAAACAVAHLVEGLDALKGIDKLKTAKERRTLSCEKR